MEISNKIPFSNPKFKKGLTPLQHKTVTDVLSSRKTITMINAPTGFGKTPTAMTLAHHINYPNQSLYLCSSKILQDQLAGDFTEAYQLKGRGNYPCTLLPTYNADRCFQQCDEYKCGEISCAYEDAKKEALSSTFTILNMHYYETETNFVGRFSKRKTVIIDEADVLEDILIDFIALDVHPKTLEKFKLDQPKYVTKLDSWKEWADKTLKILEEKVKKLRAAEDHLDRESKLELSKLLRMCLKLNMLKNDITEEWIFDHAEKFRFQPLWLDTKLTQQYLLKHAERFVMMSATMLPKVIACKLLGLDINDVDYHEIDSPIPVANRPIVYKPIKKLKYGESEEDVYNEIKRLIEGYKGIKGIIHAVSYTRAKAIAGLDKRCITHNTYDKNEKIKQFIDSKDGILVSPSCDRGLDLHGDLARFCIIPKVPFPNTTDKVVSKRLYSSPFGRVWYRAVTAQTIVQMAGRTTRCFSTDTEILTIHGWKKYNEVNMHDKTYCIDQKSFNNKTKRPVMEGSSILVEGEIEDVYTSDKEEKVINIKNQNIDALVTQDHDMIVQMRKQKTYRGKYKKPYGVYDWKYCHRTNSHGLEKIKASKLPDRFKIPLAGKIIRKNKSRAKKEWFWLIGFIIGDGHIHKNKNVVTIHQSETNIDLIEKIRKVLGILKIEYSEYRRQVKGTKINLNDKEYSRKEDMINFQITGKSSSMIRDMFNNGKRRRYSKTVTYVQRTHFSFSKKIGGKHKIDGWKEVEKIIPRWCLEKGSKSQLIKLIHGLVDSDGSWKKTNGKYNKNVGGFYNKNKIIIDAFQELCVLTGYRSLIRNRRNQYEVSFCCPSMIDCTKNNDVKDGGMSKVWCVKTNHGNVIMRRNGKPFLCGNSASDFSTVHILDAAFDSVVEFVPKWFRDAIKVEF